MRILSIKKTFSDIAARAINLDRMIEKGNRRYILAYHRILPAEVAREECVHESMWTSPEIFSDQIRWMQKVGEVVDVERILDFETENRRPLFSITFDDGWKDNYRYAFPILKKFGTNATIFLATSAIDTGHLFWPEEVLKKTFGALREGKETKIREYLKAVSGKEVSASRLNDVLDDFVEQLKELPAVERKRMISDYYVRVGADPKPIEGFILSWDEIFEMSRYGIRFGSHTHTHAILKYCDSEEILHELTLSKQILTDKLNQEIDLFCYPNARYNETDASLLERAGYKVGFRLHNLSLNKSDSRYFIPRILVNEAICENPNYFKMKLLGVSKY